LSHSKALLYFPEVFSCCGPQEARTVVCGHLRLVDEHEQCCFRTMYGHN
jgi:hypothetical protein